MILPLVLKFHIACLETVSHITITHWVYLIAMVFLNYQGMIMTSMPLITKKYLYFARIHKNNFTATKNTDCENTCVGESDDCRNVRYRSENLNNTVLHFFKDSEQSGRTHSYGNYRSRDCWHLKMKHAHLFVDSRDGKDLSLLGVDTWGRV